MADERLLSPSQVCEALGLSPKALRLYERKGLVQPHRTQTGWRVFTAPDLARLHQVKTLKQIGLTLEQIGDLLNGRLAGLAEFLTLQERVLTEELARVGRAQTLIRKALNTLARGQNLSISDIVELSRESTVMVQSDWQAFARPFYERHLTPEDRMVPISAIGARWAGLFQDANHLFTSGTDPDAKEVFDLANRWLDLSDLLTAENDELGRKHAIAYVEALSDPDAAGHMPISREVMAFLGPAFARVHLERRRETGQGWAGLVDEAKRLFEAGADPRGSEVLDLAHRWLEWAEPLVGATGEFRTKYADVYRKVLTDPGQSDRPPITCEVMDFLKPSLAQAQTDRCSTSVPARSD